MTHLVGVNQNPAKLFRRQRSSLAFHPTDLPSARRCWVRPARIPPPFMFPLTFLLTPPHSFINRQLSLLPGKLSLLPLPLITAPIPGASHKPSLSFLPVSVMNVFPENCAAPTPSFLQGSAVSTSGAGPALGFSQGCRWLRWPGKTHGGNLCLPWDLIQCHIGLLCRKIKTDREEFVLRDKSDQDWVELAGCSSKTGLLIC